MPNAHSPFIATTVPERCPFGSRHGQSQIGLQLLCLLHHLAETSDHFALRICAVDLKNEPLAAETLIKIKKCLAGAKISVEVANIKVEPLRDGAKSTLQDMFVVAKLLPRASKMLQLECVTTHPELTDPFLTSRKSAEFHLLK